MKVKATWTVTAIVSALLLAGCGAAAPTEEEDAEKKKKKDPSAEHAEAGPDLDAAPQAKADGEEGDDSAKQEDPDDFRPTERGLEIDSGVAQQMVGGLVDAMEDMTDDEEESGGDPSKVITKTCAESGDSAVVDVKVKIDRERKVLLRTTKLSVDGEHKVTVTAADGKVDCDSEGNKPKLAASDYAGLKIDASFKRQIRRSVDGALDAVDRTVSIDAEGSRQIEVKEATVANGSIQFKAEVKAKATRKLAIKSGLIGDINATIQTETSEPLQVEGVRDEATKKLKQRLIKSGKVKGETEKKTFSIEFKELKVDRENNCARSGKIEGKVFDKGSEEPGQAFTVEFNGNKIKIEGKNGRSLEVATNGCKRAEDSE